MLEQLTQGTEEPLSLSVLLFNMLIGVVFSVFLQWHFKKFGSTLTNREQFSKVFPFILLTTLLIITVVKSSLALSLGLVGALSIVRFRTPIKEPEELAYLFLAIGMGLGLGANQTVPALIAGSVILIVMSALNVSSKSNQAKNLYLSIDWNGHSTERAPEIEALNEVISQHTTHSDLRRYDLRNGSLETSYFVDIKSPGHLAQLSDELKTRFPKVGVTFIDQNQMPSI